MRFDYRRLLLALHFKSFFWRYCWRLLTLRPGPNTTRICLFRAWIFLCEINSIFTWICCVLNWFGTYRLSLVWPNPTSTSPWCTRLRTGFFIGRRYDLTLFWINYYNDVVMFLEISHLQICQRMLLDFVCDCLALTFHEFLVSEIELGIVDFIKWHLRSFTLPDIRNKVPDDVI